MYSVSLGLETRELFQFTPFSFTRLFVRLVVRVKRSNKALVGSTIFKSPFEQASSKYKFRGQSRRESSCGCTDDEKKKQSCTLSLSGMRE